MFSSKILYAQNAGFKIVRWFNDVVISGIISFLKQSKVLIHLLGNKKEDTVVF